jgi:hypothetical protein
VYEDETVIKVQDSRKDEGTGLNLVNLRSTSNNKSGFSSSRAYLVHPRARKSLQDAYRHG